MTDREAFLAAIRAKPDDDTPRLVYADYLDEQGDSANSGLAEYIRYQCEHPRPVVLATGEGFDVFVLNHPDLIELAPAVRNLSYTVRRGFVESVTCPSAAWLTHGDAIAAAHPVRTVRLTDFPSYEWQMDNLPPDWPTRPRPAGTTYPRYFAIDALEHRWPGVRFELPAETFQPITLVAQRLFAQFRVPEEMYNEMMSGPDYVSPVVNNETFFR